MLNLFLEHPAQSFLQRCSLVARHVLLVWNPPTPQGDVYWTAARHHSGHLVKSNSESVTTMIVPIPSEEGTYGEGNAWIKIICIHGLGGISPGNKILYKDSHFSSSRCFLRCCSNW